MTNAGAGGNRRSWAVRRPGCWCITWQVIDRNGSRGQDRTGGCPGRGPPPPVKGQLGGQTMPFIESADRASLFVTEWGSGPPVVFTHAWGLRSDQWDYQVPALAAAGLRCVLYDRRGHGRSDRPPAGYDLDTMADDLAAVIGHFGLRDITLVAH